MRKAQVNGADFIESLVLFICQFPIRHAHIALKWFDAVQAQRKKGCKIKNVNLGSNLFIEYLSCNGIAILLKLICVASNEYNGI
jgi:hypothetical protein